MIKVENLSKKYIIGHNRNVGGMYRYNSFRDVMAHSCRGLYQRLRHPLSPNAEKTEMEEFWALKDINFEIKQGDRVGIIGRNGAGKSTLLKILSRITEPTSGKITLNGRVASLLEVGTGFHPELTGRENIYLNGAVLGMTRIEIKKKFDEIVDFSGVEKFLDTPVKRYSSGMYVRLAFAVAAHLEPEILLVDEVLAVGDAEFQKKCLGKMEDVSKEGRTVIFVSHNMGAISGLCNRSILLGEGRIEADGNSNEVIDRYLLSKKDPIKGSSSENATDKAVRTKKKKPIFLKEANLCNGEGVLSNVFGQGEDIIIKTTLSINETIPSPVLGGIIYSENGTYIGGFNSLCDEKINIRGEKGCYEIEYTLAGLFLKGRYLLSLVVHDKSGKSIYDMHDRAYSFVVSGHLKDSQFSGLVKIPCSWKSRKIN